MLKSAVVDIGAFRIATSALQPQEGPILREDVYIPVLPQTLLRMEMGMGGTSVNLRELSQLLLGDIGATLNVFRLAGLEADPRETGPDRIEDCISNLGVQTCIDELSKRIALPCDRMNSIIETWTHASNVATFCFLWADKNDEEINPAEAYLVGLFHELGTLPTLLGWDQIGWGSSDASSKGLRIASQCSLPRCVREYFNAKTTHPSKGRWSKMVDVAHHPRSLSAIEWETAGGVSQPSDASRYM